jgi:prepilin-type N-terminal cleavage/methylation domain-containing protein
MFKMKSDFRRATGFSLVEMAVVLVIVGLLLSGLLVPLSAQMDIRNYSEARKSMNDIQEALMGYAMTNGYLPCPAISFSNGAEGSRTAGLCNSRSGHLPWAALGLPKLDNWGHLYRYSVTPAYANSLTKITLSPLTGADITIRTRDPLGNLVNLTNANVIPFAVVSMGKNGSGAINDDGSSIADTSATNVDEDTNASGTTSFVSRTFTANTNITFGGEYDDIVIWIPSSVYVSKLVTAGQLP